MNCEKTFVSWFLVVWGLNSKQNWKLSLQWIQGTHKNQTKLFIGSRTCIWCCYLFVSTVHVSVIFFFWFFFSFQLSIGLFDFTFSFFPFFRALWVLRWNLAEKSYLLMQVSTRVHTKIKKAFSHFTIEASELSVPLSRAHNIHLALWQSLRFYKWWTLVFHSVTQTHKHTHCFFFFFFGALIFRN